MPKRNIKSVTLLHTYRKTNTVTFIHIKPICFSIKPLPNTPTPSEELVKVEAFYRKYRQLRKFRKTNSHTDFEEYIHYRNTFKNMCRAKRLTLERTKRTSLIDNRHNPNNFWKNIKSQNKNTQINNYADNVPSDKWFEYFKSLFSTDRINEPPMESILDELQQERNDADLDCKITNDEIIDSLKSPKSARAPGIDGTCIEMYKTTIDTTIPFLNALFNRILQTGQFPADWCISIITPIHKKGSKDDPNNFRAISLINSLSKNFMKVLSKRLTKWAENNSVIDESQAGFRHGYSTIDNIFNLQAVIQKYLSKLKNPEFNGLP